MPDAHITVTEILDDFDAQRSDMRDSPTILINGNNPFDGLDSVTSYACRIGPHTIPLGLRHRGSGRRGRCRPARDPPEQQGTLS